MSLENLKEYARRCATEPELLARARELGLTDLEGHMQEAGGLGLEWDKDDMIALRKEMIDAAGDGELEDLGEEDLEKVAGGVISSTAILVGMAAIGVVGAAVGGGVAAATVGKYW